jgi:glycosyltransferase involved in cell wall biosynthesis
MPRLLSIIIPAYNEEKRIGQSLDDVLRFLSSEHYSAEVIVVNDGSRDRTAEVVNNRVSKYRAAGFDLRLLTNDPNRGKGYSIKRGMSEAAGDIVLFTDADMSSPISEAPKLIEPIISNQADVVFGSRALNRSLIGVHQSKMRELGGRFFNLCLRIITGMKFKDTQCGFKAFRREAAVPVFQLQSIERFGFDPEVLYIAKKRRLRLLEVPVVWNHSEGSTVDYSRDAATMFTDLVRIRINDISGRYKAASQEPTAERRGVAGEAGRPR